MDIMRRMEWKYILYKRQELENEEGLSPEIENVFEMVKARGIGIRGMKEESISDCIIKSNILPEEALLITTRDDTLAEAAGLPIASIGYRHADFSHEGLYQADILVEGFEEVDAYFLERIYQRKHNIPWRVIETGRCYLREMTLDDLDDLYEMYADPSITEYMEPLYERKQEEEYTRAYINNMYRFYGYGMWLIKDRKTHEFIGRAGLNNLEIDGEEFLEMGYAIKVSHQRKGYASEVCQAVIDYAKGAELGYEKLHCFVWEGNYASMVLLERLNFSYTGERWRDGRKMLVYELLLF